MKYAFIASGNGAFCKFIHNNSRYIPDAQLSLVVTDRPCGVYDHFNEKTDVPSFILDFNSFDSKESYEDKLLELLQDHHIDYTFLMYKRLIGQKIMDAFPNRMVNIHLSLLPLFIGPNSVKRAYDSNMFFYGSTIHLIDGSVDQGPVIAQLVLGRDFDDDVTLYDHKLYRHTSAMLLDVIHKLSTRQLQGMGNYFRFSDTTYGTTPFNPMLDLDMDKLDYELPR